MRCVELLCLLGVFCLSTTIAFAQSREQKVRGDKTKFEAAGFWIYNDLAKGVAEAKKTNQPRRALPSTR